MIADIFFDSTCCVCGRLGRLLCSSCLAVISSLSPVTRTIGQVDVHAVGWYRGELRTVIRQAKNFRARAVLINLSPTIRRLLDFSRPVPVIPIPPSRPGKVRRGYGLARPIAMAIGWPICDVLVIRDPGSQRGRGAEQRTQDRRFTIRGRVPSRAILVDDVVTTGATVSAAIAALADAGCRVVGVFALALVPPR